MTDDRAPLRMTTTVAREGGKAPAIAVAGWHYDERYFPAGQHTPGSYPGQLADVYARHTLTFALDVDGHKDGKREAWEASATGRYLAGREPYVRRGTAGSVRFLVAVTPGQAAAWWPAASGVPAGWGEIRSRGIAPSPGARHPGGDIYAYVPGPDPVLYPADGTVLGTNVIRFDEGLKAALIADGAHERDERAMTGGDAELPGDDIRCSLASSWLADGEHFNGTAPRGEHANRAVNYLKRMDAEGHLIGGWLDEVIARLPETSREDFAAMWATAPVPADTVAVPWPCCSPLFAVPALALPAAPAAWPDEVAGTVAGTGGRVAQVNGQPAGTLLAGMKTGADLNVAVFPPLHYHIDGLVPEGLTVLSGAPKIGKSWLVLGWLLKLAAARNAVLYLALEDSHRRMQWRCRHLLGTGPIPAAFCYMTEEDVVPGMLLPTVAEFVRGCYDGRPLIVVDTLAKAQQQTPRIKDEAAYERDYRVTSNLQALVKGCPGAGLVICHHDRKAGGEDWIDRISGTKGVTGGPDAVMYLERKRSETAGALHVTGRDIAENDYAMTFADASRWEFDGGSLPAAAAAYLARRAQAGLGDRSAAIVDLAHASGAKGIRRGDVTIATGISPHAASEYLRRLADSARLRNPERGLYMCVCFVCSPPSSSGAPPRLPETPSPEHTQHTPSPPVHARAREAATGSPPLGQPGPGQPMPPGYAVPPAPGPPMPSERVVPPGTRPDVEAAVVKLLTEESERRRKLSDGEADP